MIGLRGTGVGWLWLIAWVSAECLAGPAYDDETLRLQTTGWWSPVYRVEPSGTIEPLELDLYPADELGFHQPGQPLVSPDQQWIAFTRNNDVWLHRVGYELEYPISYAGQPSTERFKPVFVTAREWSPDSRYLVYEVAGHRLETFCNHGRPIQVAREADYGFYRHDLETGKTLRLDESRDLAHFLIVEHVAWLNSETFLVKANAPVDTTEFPVQPHEVVYQLPDDVSPTHYFEVSADGGGFEFVGGFPGSASQEDVSPDGRRMAAYVARPGANGRSVSQLWTLDLETGVTEPLTRESTWDHLHQGPLFSPGGESIAYQCTRAVCDDEACRRRHEQNRLNVGSKSVAVCEPWRMLFEWIDDRSVVVLCDESLRVVDVRNATELNRVQVPQPED